MKSEKASHLAERDLGCIFEFEFMTLVVQFCVTRGI